MSVSAPPRPGTPGGAGGAPRGSSSHAGQRGDGVILGDRPIRRPDTRSPRVMTRRAWWLVVLNFLLPGSAQSLAGSRRLARVGLTATLVMWLLVIAGVVALWTGLAGEAANVALVVIGAVLAVAGLGLGIAALTFAKPLSHTDLQAGWAPDEALGSTGTWVSDRKTSWIIAN